MHKAANDVRVQFVATEDAESVFKHLPSWINFIALMVTETDPGVWRMLRMACSSITPAKANEVFANLVAMGVWEQCELGGSYVALLEELLARMKGNSCRPQRKDFWGDTLKQVAQRQAEMGNMTCVVEAARQMLFSIAKLNRMNRIKVAPRSLVRIHILEGDACLEGSVIKRFPL